MARKIEPRKKNKYRKKGKRRKNKSKNKYKTFKIGDPIRITKKGFPKICDEDDPRKCGYLK